MWTAESVEVKRRDHSNSVLVTEVPVVFEGHLDELARFDADPRASRHLIVEVLGVQSDAGHSQPKFALEGAVQVNGSVLQVRDEVLAHHHGQSVVTQVQSRPRGSDGHRLLDTREVHHHARANARPQPFADADARSDLSGVDVVGLVRDQHAPEDVDFRLLRDGRIARHHEGHLGVHSCASDRAQKVDHRGSRLVPNIG